MAALNEKGVSTSLSTTPGDPDVIDRFAGPEVHLTGLETVEWMLDAADGGMGFAVMLQEAQKTGKG